MKFLPQPQNIYHIYRITNLVNGKVYIGQTMNPKLRWAKHKTNKKNRHLYGSFKKYGIENFSFEVLLSNLTKEQADRVEIRLIKRYKATDPNIGYNNANGGSHGTYSQATKDRLSVSHKKYFETHTHPLLGTHMSKERYEHHMSTRLRGKDSPWWCNGSKVEQIDTKTGEVIAVYPAVSEAYRQTGIQISNIVKVCKGKRDKAGGYKWRYCDENIESKVI